MNNLVEYKTTINSDQAKISNLNDELSEHEKELQNATAKIEELVIFINDNYLWYLIIHAFAVASCLNGISK